MREAQKTYRIKKEAAIESCKTRTTELEQKLQKMVDLLIDCHESSSHLNLHVTHPLVYKHLQKMKDHLAPDSGAFNQTPVDQNSSTNIDLDGAVFHTLSNMNHSTHTSMFGYEVSDHLVLNNESSNIDLEYGQSSQQTSSDSNITWDLEMPPYPGLRDSDRLFGRSTRVAYCFQEPMFGRRMHRYYLEYAYRMFVDRRADPSVIYRIFRMVPCIRDKEKMIPYFRNLVHAGIGERLEILSLPFYCIGDAGRHYKRKDSLGNLTYPTNTRLPRRVLGILPTTERSTESSSQSGRGHLQLFGLDGEWFDCYDVEGYLIKRRVNLEENTLFAKYNPRLNPIPGQGLIFGSSLFGTSLRDDTQSGTNHFMFQVYLTYSFRYPYPERSIRQVKVCT